MADRYFCESPVTGQQAELVGPEAHHLAHVMRAKPGTQVMLFDGSGFEFTAQVERIGRSTIELAIIEHRSISRELIRDVTVAVALPKGDRQRWLVEKLTELGCARLIPLITARGVAQPFEGALAKLRRAVIEASKQCGRNRLMQIGEPQSWSDLVQQQSVETNRTPGQALAEPVAHGTEALAKSAAHATLEPARWIAHPPQTLPENCAPRPNESFMESLIQLERTRPIVFAVGPEGGFTEEEIDLAVAAGWRRVELGRRILRVETAAIALMAIAAGAAHFEVQQPAHFDTILPE